MALSLAPLALGVRLSSVRGYAAAARSALLALTVAGLTVVALYAAAAPAVIGAQYDRAVARAPIVVSESPSVSLWYGERPNTWAGHDVTQAYVLGGERAPAPPGVPRLPQPGEVWLSPALVELAEDDRVIAALFDGYRQVGTISLEGLLRPGELRAVVGIDRPRQWMYPISAYGTDEGPFFDDPLSASPVVLLVGGMLVVLVVSPALALLVLTAQVSAAARRTRVLALRTLGMTPGRTRVVVAVETTLVALPAAVAGLVGFLLARPHIASVPTTGYDFFAAEANVPISVLVGVPVLFAVLTTAIAIVSVPAVPRDTVRPLLHRPAPRRLSLLFAAVGGAGLLALPFIPDFLGGQTGTFVLTGATLCLALGLPLGAPALVSGVARRLARVAPRAGGLLGFRSSAAEPGLAVRMGGAMSAALIAIGVAAPIVSLFEGGDRGEEGDLPGGSTAVVLGLVAAQEVVGWEDVNAAFPIVAATGRPGQHFSALVAGCDDLARMVRAPVRNCDGRVQWLSTLNFSFTASFPGEPPPRVRLPGGRSVPTPPLDRPADAFGPTRLDGFLLVPPSTLPGDVPSEVNRGLVAKLSDHAEAGELFRARMTALDATAEVEILYDDNAEQRSTDYIAPLAIIRTGVAVAMLLGMLSVCTAALGDATARRRRVRGLLVLGSPRGELLRAHAATMAVPLALLALLSVACGWLAARVMEFRDDRTAVPSLFYLQLAGLSLAGILVITVVTSPFLLRALSDDELRQE